MYFIFYGRNKNQKLLFLKHLTSLLITIFWVILQQSSLLKLVSFTLYFFVTSVSSALLMAEPVFGQRFFVFFLDT